MQNVVLTNSGQAPLVISNVTTGPMFPISNNSCPPSLAAGANCTIQIIFQPTTAGDHLAALTITNDAFGNPHTVSLTGRGLAPPGQPAVSLSSTSLEFGKVGLQQSARQNVTLTNTGNEVLTINTIGVEPPEFQQSHTCPDLLDSNTSCTISIDFTPLISGPVTGLLTIDDDAPGSPHTVDLAGVGVASAIQIRTVLAENSDQIDPIAFTLNGETFQLLPDDLVRRGGLSPGEYLLTETLPKDWVWESINCDNGTFIENSATTVAEVTINLAVEEEVTCTFTNKYDPPTAVDLTSFTAEGSATQITLRWATGNEVDSEGFNIWRSEQVTGPYSKLNGALIPARGNSFSGASYEFIDTTVLKGKTYAYKLEDIDTFAASTFHGPILTTASDQRRTYLPLILK